MQIRYTIKTSHSDPALGAFEEALGYKTGYRCVTVPPAIGEGRLLTMDIAEGFHANFQAYRLNVPLQITKSITKDLYDCLYVVFYHLNMPAPAIVHGTELIFDQGVNIYAQPIDAVIEFPAHTQRNVVCMRIDRARLAAMLGENKEEYLDGLLQKGEAFFLHEPLSPEMRNLLVEMGTPPSAKNLRQLFYRVRAQQLLYLLMEQLNKRTTAAHRNGNPADIAKVFKARQLLTQDLAEPPTITDLSRSILMSESRLKQIFREVFGVSIYQYFQLARLERAKELLAENKRTVQEVGYELGFTNIGHFSRIFERTYHVKPKKFQLGVGADSTGLDNFLGQMDNL